MKSFAFPLFALPLLLSLAPAVVRAADLTWDGNAAAAPNPFDGAAAWNNADARWWTGTTNQVWITAGAGTPLDTAVFGGAAVQGRGIPGAVTLGVAQGAGGLRFLPYVGNNTKFNVTALTLTLNGTAPFIETNTDWVRPFAAINTILAGTTGIEVRSNGTGILEFGAQLNTFTGGLKFQGGSVLSIASDSGLGAAANPVVFAGSATLVARANFTAAATHPVTLQNGSEARFDCLGTSVLTLAGPVTETGGAGRLSKQGSGSLILQAVNGYTGATTVRQGTVTLEFNTGAGPAVNIINPASALGLNGGTLVVSGKAGVANTQTFSGTAFGAGASRLTALVNGATSLTTNLGGWTRAAGATLNLDAVAAEAPFTTTTAAANALGWATVANTDFAQVAGGILTSFSTYQLNGNPASWGATDNVSLSADPAGAVNTTDITTLRTNAAVNLNINNGQTLTLSGGGLLVAGGGALNLSGGTLRGAPGADLAVHQHDLLNTATVTSVIADNGGAVALTKSGAGALVLGGNNTYSGNTFLNAGRLEISSDSHWGTGPEITLRSGTVLTISGVVPITSAKNLRCDYGSDTLGIGMGGAATDLGNFTLDVQNEGGVTLSGSVTVTAGTFAKRGTGNLTLTNPGLNRLGRLNGGLASTIGGGTVTFNGGAASVWELGQGELTIGDGSNPTAAAARAAVVVLESGTFRNGSFTSIGRGNGNTALESGLILRGGTWSTGNLYAGFANGVAGYNARPFVTASNAVVVDVADTARIAESSGCDSTWTFSGTSQLNINNSLQAGFGGKGTLRINDSAAVRTGQLWVGGSNVAANTGAGAIIQTGGSLAQQGVLGTGTAADWRIGGFTGVNDVNASGAYLISGGTFNTGVRNFQVGAYGRGTLDISGGGSVSATGGFPVVGRYAGGFGVMNVSGGSFTNTGADSLLIIGEAGSGVLNVSGTGTVAISGGPRGAGNGGGTGGIRLGHAASGVGILNLNGGSVTTSGIAKSAATAVGHLYLNGGTLIAGAANATFLQGLDQAVVGPNGVTVNTNSFAITISQPLLQPTGPGLWVIPVTDGGSGYLFPPIVQITGGGGTGAAAVAVVSGGVVTGITITSPGINYTSDPVVNLLGGGFATPAVVGLAIPTTVIGAGAFVKTGDGVLTLSGANTYALETRVEGGTLRMTQAVLADTAPIQLNNNGVLDLSFTGTDTVSSLYINGQPQAPGTWGAVGSGAARESSLITGTGLLNVANGSSGTSPYQTWATTTKGLAGAAAAADSDPDKDGVANLLEFIFGSEPNPATAGASSTVAWPTTTVDATHLEFIYRRTALSTTQSGLAVTPQYGSSLNSWTAAVNGINGVTITTLTDGFGAGIDRVTVRLPRTLASDGRLFNRLRALLAP